MGEFNRLIVGFPRTSRETAKRGCWQLVPLEVGMSVEERVFVLEAKHNKFILNGIIIFKGLVWHLVASTRSSDIQL